MPIAGQVTAATVRPQGGMVKVSFKFEKLLTNELEQLDIALIDAILERLNSF